jgi:parallel beta-helix repeat protein
MWKAKRTLGALGLGMVAMALALLGGGLGAAPAWAQNCGDTIGPGGIVTLPGNVGPCATNPALTVVGPVIFNLNGFTVSCDTTATDGIVVQGSRAVVSNGTVTGCDDGVQLDGDGRHVITRIISRLNGNEGFEINSHRNALSFNIALDNGDDGFEIRGSFNVLSFNKARRNDEDGFDIGGDSVNNKLITNTAEDNIDDGFQVGGADHVLKFNHANRNGRGFIILENASNNRLSFNVAFANEFDGFDVEGDNNSLTRNVAKQNGADGIGVETDATGNVLEENVAFDNNQNGAGDFDLADDNVDCDANTWVDNFFGTKSQACIS